ncbi:site-specific integrase [Geodermatophilus normandii]|uniref:Site-specific integrase n=1 Tax=Geodermatophilus normandii TaxID=1137989 RepID=A0A6P0GND3_9ACTN|nr:site-specific integrase [Geodermatophilus normandii]NEM08888.1 site-specific integrase [Geodermatophilus normandii]
MPRPPLAVGTFGKVNFLALGKGRIRAQVSFRDFDGRRRSVTRFGRTKAEAERRLRAALRDRASAPDEGNSADSRLATVATAWLMEVDDSDLAAGTKRLYRFAVQNYVLPGIGQLRLREITVPAVDRLLTAVRTSHGAGAAKATRSVLSGILAEAVRRGALPTNPVREVASRRSHRRPAPGPRALTVDEVRQLRERLGADEEAARLDLPDLIEFMLGTGVRIGEACAVRWAAVDLDAATLRVEATLIRVPGRGLAIQQAPKTTAGRRTIALPTFIVDLLRHRQAWVPAADGSAVVFHSPTGRLRDPHNTSSNLRQALDRAGFDWVTSHVFRKTVATRLDEAGLSARQIADHLGHNRPSLTQDVYMGRGLAAPEAAEALERRR